MPEIFISYRVQDHPVYAALLHRERWLDASGRTDLASFTRPSEDTDVIRVEGRSEPVAHPDLWKPYASLAAAYTRELLAVTPPLTGRGGHAFPAPPDLSEPRTMSA